MNDYYENKNCTLYGKKEPSEELTEGNAGERSLCMKRLINQRSQEIYLTKVMGPFRILSSSFWRIFRGGVCKYWVGLQYTKKKGRNIGWHYNLYITPC